MDAVWLPRQRLNSGHRCSQNCAFAYTSHALFKGRGSLTSLAGSRCVEPRDLERGWLLHRIYEEVSVLDAGETN
eukprot:1103100-Amphidinium_carterae.1